MKKIVKINGMHCPKCENHVKEALSKYATVESVSHETGEAILSDVKVDDTIIKNTIADLDFEVTEIKEA